MGHAGEGTGEVTQKQESQLQDHSRRNILFRPGRRKRLFVRLRHFGCLEDSK